MFVISSNTYGRPQRIEMFNNWNIPIPSNEPFMIFKTRKEAEKYYNIIRRNICIRTLNDSIPLPFYYYRRFVSIYELNQSNLDYTIHNNFFFESFANDKQRLATFDIDTMSVWCRENNASKKIAKSYRNYNRNQKRKSLRSLRKLPDDVSDYIADTFF